MVTLAKSMYPTSDKIDKIASGYLITPKIPQGLAAAVEGLTREVIRHHPNDIYVFAAQHFEKLLQLREQYSRSVDQQWNINQDSPVYFDIKDYYKDFNESNHEIHDTRCQSKYTKYNKLAKNDEFLKHKRKKAYGRDVKSRSPKVISGLMAANKDIKNKLRKNRISTSQEGKNGVTKSDRVAIKKLDSMDKVKSYVVDKFAQTLSMDELQSVNYTDAVQTVIDTNTPVINKKYEELKSSKMQSQESRESKEIQFNNLNNLNSSSNVLATRLNETHNLLKDISSCFPKLSALQSRPRSADAVHNFSNYTSASDKLEAMLNETHHLLLGISKNFFQTNELQKSKSEDYEHMATNSNNNINLPSVQSPSSSSAHILKNITKNGSKFALPPVTTSSSSSTPTDSKSPKTKQDLTLPILLPTSESTKAADDTAARTTNDSASDEALQNDKNDATVPDIVEIFNLEEHSRKTTPEQLCYMLTSDESPLFQIPYNVTTVIIPDREMLSEPTHAQCLTDPFSSLIGEVVSATLTSEEMRELHPTLELAAVMTTDKLKFHKQNLQCINEEDGVSDDFKDDDKLILEEIIDNDDGQTKGVIIEEKVVEENVQIDNVEESANNEEEIIEKNIDNLDENFTREDESELSSTTKETSPTDGPLESPLIYEKTETGQTISKSTDLIESSNEAKETTLTDGVSLLSLDDPVRPYVPELNLDSLQDITISSFKMTEDEYDFQQDEDNDRTNSIVGTPTLNLNDSGDGEDITPGDGDEIEKPYVIDDESTNGKTADLSENMQENACDVMKGEFESPGIAEIEILASAENTTTEEKNITDIVENIESNDEQEKTMDLIEEKEEKIKSLEETEEEIHITDENEMADKIPEEKQKIEKLTDEDTKPEESHKPSDEEAENLNKDEGLKENSGEADEQVISEENDEQLEKELNTGNDETIKDSHEENGKKNEDESKSPKEQSTEIIPEIKSELIEDDQCGRIIPGLTEINPSAEDTIVLETLLNSQESIELHEMEEAVTKIQAGVRGFLIRRRITNSQSKNNSCTTIFIQNYVTDSDDKKESSVESQDYDIIKIQDTAAKKIQNNYRSYQTRKRLYRENAMQKTTTISKEKPSIENSYDENILQHTGEFHDCIALPLFDISSDSNRVKRVALEKCENEDSNSIEDK